MLDLEGEVIVVNIVVVIDSETEVKVVNNYILSSQEHSALRPVIMAQAFRDKGMLHITCGSFCCRPCRCTRTRCR